MTKSGNITCFSELSLLMFTRSLPDSVDVSGFSSLLPFTHMLDIPALCSDVNVVTV